jgi:prepilin-type N-terminal cleavage/methylation domain-containing protein/prepilin-type processing-associated H-X9-DG protein
MKHSRAFTLVELLVVVGIIAVLISILLPSLNKARQRAANVRSMSSLKQLTFTYLEYATQNRGTLLPGFLPEKTPTNEDWAVSDKMSGHVFVGRAARQWPWRLSTLNPGIWKLIRPSFSSTDLPTSMDTAADAEAKAYNASQYPIFGLNMAYLGGHAPSLRADIGGPKDYFRGFSAECRPKVGGHVAFKINDVKRTADQIVFCEVIAANASGPIDSKDTTALNGMHFATPPFADTASGPYWNVTKGKATMLIPTSTRRVLGLPGSRNGSGIPVGFLDGHVESRPASDLLDMRNWAPRVKGPGSQY